MNDFNPQHLGAWLISHPRLEFACHLEVAGRDPPFLHLAIAGVGGTHPPPAILVYPNHLHLLVQRQGHTIVVRTVGRDGLVVTRSARSLHVHTCMMGKQRGPLQYHTQPLISELTLPGPYQ